MIHILTVHWQDDSWVDVQLDYLKRHFSEPYLVYAFLNDLSAEHTSKFHYVCDEPIRSHAVKLNLLADIVKMSGARDDDWLVFMDGDAFPIADVVPYCREKLASYPLLAVQRPENNGDVQPHPSFCATTVGFWSEIGGDWKKGKPWQDSHGHHVTDVGGNLLHILEERGIEWYPLKRTNSKDLHPVWFGIYDNVIYHHGAGFRTPQSRADFVQAEERHRDNLAYIFRKVAYPFLPTNRWTQNLRKKLSPRRWIQRQIHREGEELSEYVFSQIMRDGTFYEEFVR